MKQLQHKDALQFIFAGKSVFTVINPKTDNKFTFKVTKSKNEKFYFVGCCGRCGRTLTVNESIDMGIGPECIKMLSKEDKRDVILKLLLA